jgi:predicted Rossmann fold flavoprotein
MAHRMHYDIAIIGAGAAGMMCAAHAPGRCLLVDHAKAPGEKIRISGGGRCNFTNLHCTPEAFLSENQHFAKSALARYTQHDFIELVERHGIAWHEKTLGQLFCDVSAKDIIGMLMKLLRENEVDVSLQTSVSHFAKSADRFSIDLDVQGSSRSVTAQTVVIATGGKSIPKMGASGFAYDTARQFGLRVTETRPALVPFTFSDKKFAALSGVSLPVRMENARAHFDEAMLFTHRGLSGPAVLQMSSYWREGEAVTADLAPRTDLAEALRHGRQMHGRRKLTTELSRYLPARLVDYLSDHMNLTGNLADLSDRRIARLASDLHAWTLLPGGTEGYRTAEVTLGGVDTATLDAKSLEVRSVPGLFFIGEAVDVTGWLGGYNFQWAWSSAMAAARALKDTVGPRR